MGMALDELKEGDEKVTVEGIDFIYNKWDDRYLPDSIIDFEDSYMGQRFVVRSAAPSAC